MKKLFKLSLTVCAVACAATAFSGCSDKSVTGEAYGLVHGGSYVGCATVTRKGDTVKDVTLNEVCFPTQVTATDSVAAEDRVTDDGEEYYKTVSYADITLTYTQGKGYMHGETSFADLMSTEANAKEYFEAVMAGNVTVTVGGQQKSDVMTKSALSKDENGYWTRTDKDGNSYSRWKMNRDAAVKYVREHGVENLTQLVKSDSALPDAREDKDVNYWFDGSVNTGATWVDFNSADAEGYFTYAKLILAAYEAAQS